MPRDYWFYIDSSLKNVKSVIIYSSSSTLIFIQKCLCFFNYYLYNGNKNSSATNIFLNILFNAVLGLFSPNTVNMFSWTHISSNWMQRLTQEWLQRKKSKSAVVSTWKNILDQNTLQAMTVLWQFSLRKHGDELSQLTICII